MKKCVEIIVYGTVQDVGFRVAVLREARDLSVKGFAMNAPDGTVYIEAEGDEGDVDKFIDWCRKGPIGATVKSVDLKVCKDIKGFDGFQIRG